MADRDRSLIDQVKDALGMGSDRDSDDRDEIHEDDLDREHQMGADPEARRLDDEPGIDGATQATGSEGVSGGMGASGAMGGAGAGGPVGATPDPSEEISGPAPGSRVRTEYEMGHELDPDHERVAESGVIAERRGDADVDTWGDDDRRPE